MSVLRIHISGKVHEEVVGGWQMADDHEGGGYMAQTASTATGTTMEDIMYVTKANNCHPSCSVRLNPGSNSGILSPCIA